MLWPTTPASVITSVSTSGDSMMFPLAVRCGSIGTRTALTLKPVTVGNIACRFGVESIATSWKGGRHIEYTDWST